MRSLIKVLLVLSFFSIPILQSEPVEACWACKTWKREVWKPIKAEARRFGEKITREFSNLKDRVGDTVTLLYNSGKSIGRAVEDFIKNPSLESLANIGLTAVNTVTYIGCDVDEIAEDLFAICFKSRQVNAIKAGYRVLSNPFLLNFNSINTPPYRHVLNKVQMIYRGNSVRNLLDPIKKLDGSDDQWAYFVGKDQGIVYFNDSAFDDLRSPYSFGALMVHEADHGRFGAHSAGDCCDEDARGPYGTEVKYLLQMYIHGVPGKPSMAPADCEDILHWAGRKLESQIGRGRDYNILMRYYHAPSFDNNCAP